MNWLYKRQNHPQTTIDLRTVKRHTTKRRFGDSRSTRRRVAVISLSIVILAALCVGAWFIWRAYSKSQNLDSVGVVVARVNRHFILPTDEQPALATVTDVSKLTTPFLKKSADGDKVLIYQKNRIAVIYRPSIDRVVAVGPVTIDTPPPVNQTGN